MRLSALAALRRDREQLLSDGNFLYIFIYIYIYIYSIYYEKQFIPYKLSSGDPPLPVS